jgi:hypothetical protein
MPTTPQTQPVSDPQQSSTTTPSHPPAAGFSAPFPARRSNIPATTTRFSTWDRTALEKLAEELTRELIDTKAELALALKFWRREVQKNNSAGGNREQN